MKESAKQIFQKEEKKTMWFFSQWTDCPERFSSNENKHLYLNE